MGADLVLRLTTGLHTGNVAQNNPNASLGGDMSSTELSNSVALNSLFDNVLAIEALVGDTEYRYVDVYNQGDVQATNVLLLMDVATSSLFTTILFGIYNIEQPHSAAWANGEILANESTVPPHISSWKEAIPGDALSLPNIAAGYAVRIGIKRVVTALAPGDPCDIGTFGIQWQG